MARVRLKQTAPWPRVLTPLGWGVVLTLFLAGCVGLGYLLGGL